MTSPEQLLAGYADAPGPSTALLALGDVVHARHHRLLQFDVLARKDRKERRPERIELLLGVRNIENLEPREWVGTSSATWKGSHGVGSSN